MPLVQPAPWIRYQFFDGSGNPLAFGWVYTFIAGTNTPLATYVDHNGVTQNTNPIHLDAGGYADIWLTATSYKIRVEDTNHVALYTIDGIPGIGTLISVGSLSPLFTTTFAAGGLTFNLTNAAAGTIFGNFTGGAGPPSYSVIGGNREITFNNAGQMDGDPNFEWDPATFTMFVSRSGNAFTTPAIRLIAGAAGAEIKFGTGVDPSIIAVTAWQFTAENGQGIALGQRAEQTNFSIMPTLGEFRFGVASHFARLGLNDGTGAAGVFTGPEIIAGTGTPESVITARIGSIFMRADGGAGTSMYIKQSGTGNTGWAAVTP